MVFSCHIQALVLLFNEENILFVFVCLSDAFVFLVNGVHMVAHS